MIAPLPRAAIAGASSATRKHGTFTFTSYTPSKSASVCEAVGPNGKMPALLTRMSMWPPPSSTALRASSRAGLAGQRGGDEVGLAAGGADALDALVAAGGVSPGHDDVGAVQGQAGGGGAA